MSDLAKVGRPSLATATPPTTARTPAGLLAGEALAAGDACYLKGADGKLYRSVATATSTDESNKVFGYAATDYGINDAATLYYGVRFRYSTGMTPGTFYYLSTTAGALATTSTAGQTAVIAVAMDATRIEVKRSF
jgi:hypothetical protein